MLCLCVATCNRCACSRTTSSCQHQLVVELEPWGMGSDWHLEAVTVDPKEDGEEVVNFPCDQWFSKKMGYVAHCGHVDHVVPGPVHLYLAKHLHEDSELHRL